MTISELPNDIDALKHLVMETHQKVVVQEKQLTVHREELADRENRIKELQEQLAFLKHKLFGRKGEKINPAQLSLFNELTAQGGTTAKRNTAGRNHLHPLKRSWPQASAG